METNIKAALQKSCYPHGYAALLGVLAALSVTFAGTPGDKPEENVPWCLQTFLARVPPLKHAASGRLPLIAWEPFRCTPDDRSFDEGKPLPNETYRKIGRRGFTQRIPMSEKFIPMALAIQKAGLPVVFVEGSGGLGPVLPDEDCTHQLPNSYKRTKDEPVYHCPLLIAGWQYRAEQVRATLRKFKKAGIQVTAAWLDWEDEPWGLPDRWQQAAACPRCQAAFPSGVLANANEYARFMGPFRRQILSAYLAAPIREIYPRCSITNWALVFSSVERPTHAYWGDSPCSPRAAPGDIGFFTATNPIVYGDTVYRDMHWKNEWGWPLDAPHMDRLYTECMLGNVSDNAYNQQRMAPWKQCIPWVARYCPENDDESIPILSRERYREILRHVWLRGADSMQIFNAHRPNHPAIATEEIEDAVAVYDEMLEYRQFLGRGWILNTEAPTATDDGAIWSGLRLEKRAVIRAFTQVAQTVRFKVKPWDNGPELELEAPPSGRTYLLTRDRDAIRVEKREH